MFPMTPADAPSQLEQLPRGRHGLSPETVAESQRGRILTAMVEVTAKRGYADCRIADVIAYAGVSRKTFYELFSDKEDCFLAAYDLWLGRLFTITAEAFDAGDRGRRLGRPGPDRRWRRSSSSSPSIPRRPGSASSRCSRPGPKALARRDAGVRQFTAFIDAGRAETTAQLPGITALAIVGGIHELLYSEIIHGATAQLPAGCRSSCSGSSIRSSAPSARSPSATGRGRCSPSGRAPSITAGS